MKNMKIEINADQPLDEVVMELERLGFEKSETYDNSKTQMITTNKFDGTYTNWSECHLGSLYATTLQQLREMK